MFNQTPTEATMANEKIYDPNAIRQPKKEDKNTGTQTSETEAAQQKPPEPPVVKPGSDPSETPAIKKEEGD